MEAWEGYMEELNRKTDGMERDRIERRDRCRLMVSSNGSLDLTNT